MAGSILGGISQDATLGDVLRALEVIAKTLGANDNGKMLVSVANTPAMAQSGTWTVQPGNTANTTPWLVNFTNASASLYGPQGFGLDQHYASQQAYGSIRDRITVT